MSQGSIGESCHLAIYGADMAKEIVYSHSLPYCSFGLHKKKSCLIYIADNEAWRLTMIFKLFSALYHLCFVFAK